MGQAEVGLGAGDSGVGGNFSAFAIRFGLWRAVSNLLSAVFVVRGEQAAKADPVDDAEVIPRKSENKH